MKFTQFTFGLQILFLFLITATLAGFGWNRKKTLKELADAAPIVCVAKVQNVKAEYGKYQGRDGFIYTYVQVLVETPFKGVKKGESISIKIHGGKIGENVIAGDRSFNFEKNEEVLLFLAPSSKDYYEVYSISGKLSVFNDQNGTFFDTSMLKDDDVAQYGEKSSVSKENILNRLSGYIAENEGKSR